MSFDTVTFPEDLLHLSTLSRICLLANKDILFEASSEHRASVPAKGRLYSIKHDFNESATYMRVCNYPPPPQK